jgi:hypothetical protein
VDDEFLVYELEKGGVTGRSSAFGVAELSRSAGRAANGWRAPPERSRNESGIQDLGSQWRNRFGELVLRRPVELTPRLETYAAALRSLAAVAATPGPYGDGE